MRAANPADVPGALRLPMAYCRRCLRCAVVSWALAHGHQRIACTRIRIEMAGGRFALRPNVTP